MSFLQFLFWVFIFVLLYSYILYGIVLIILLGIRKIFTRRSPSILAGFETCVTLIVAAYNEEKTLHEKISNTLELDYPSDKLFILFVTDGSSDSTNEILAGYPQIKTLFRPERRGKVAAINRAMKFVDTPITVFCDANTFLNRACLRELIKHYTNRRIGAVAGEKKVVDDTKEVNTAGAGEGLYWKYESFLKKLDSAFYSVVGAAGELFSIRTELYEEVPEKVLLDDFIISLRIAQKGYRVIYEPAAYAVEEPSANMKEEQKRKVRIGAGGFQSIYMLRGLLNIFKYGKLSFQYISHRVLRWAVCPFLLPLILILNIILYMNTPYSIYKLLLAAQLFFYLCAWIGYLMARKNKKFPLFYVPYYFVFMNISLYFGLVRILKGKQSVLWERAIRKSDDPGEIPISKD